MSRTIHVDENGNIRKGPPLPLPRVLDGIYETSTRSSYLNTSGTESNIPPPITGRATLASMSPEELRHATSHAEPVENGLHHGHVMNDDNNDLDESELAGINQVPYAPFMRMLYTPYNTQGTLFTSQKRPPPGAPKDPGPGLPKAPGGGVAPPAAIAGEGGVRGGGLHGGGLSGRTKRAGLTDFDAGRANAEEERRIAQLGTGSIPFGSVTNRLKQAQQRGFADGWNPLEMASEQAAKVLSDAGTYALKKGSSAVAKIMHHGISSASKKLKGAFGVSKKSKKKSKKKSSCKKCARKGHKCKKCRG